MWLVLQAGSLERGAVQSSPSSPIAVRFGCVKVCFEICYLSNGKTSSANRECHSVPYQLLILWLEIRLGELYADSMMYHAEPHV